MIEECRGRGRSGVSLRELPLRPAATPVPHRVKAGARRLEISDSPLIVRPTIRVNGEWRKMAGLASTRPSLVESSGYRKPSGHRHGSARRARPDQRHRPRPRAHVVVSRELRMWRLRVGCCMGPRLYRTSRPDGIRAGLSAWRRGLPRDKTCRFDPGGRGGALRRPAGGGDVGRAAAE